MLLGRMIMLSIVSINDYIIIHVAVSTRPQAGTNYRTRILSALAGLCKEFY